MGREVLRDIYRISSFLDQPLQLTISVTPDMQEEHTNEVCDWFVCSSYLLVWLVRVVTSSRSTAFIAILWYTIWSPGHLGRRKKFSDFETTISYPSTGVVNQSKEI